ncbi:MAG TPA: preprotein translocase subunit YajC [Pirellulaceae bacterium]|nr:preprotein translocase subunit YajC [Pirellulaceae bacterium]
MWSIWWNELNLLAFQVSKVPGTDAAPAAAGGEGAAGEPSFFGSLLMFLPMMLVIMLVFMMVTQRPQQKEQQRLNKLLAEMKKNDRVITAGGIVGTVVNFGSDSEYVTLRIDEASNAKMQVLKQSIVRVIRDKDESESSKK